MLVETLQKLSIPEQPGVISIHPELPKWPELLIENREATRKVPQRPEVCNELLRIARNYTLNVLDLPCKTEATKNVIATGHQAVWHHCGIWVKTLAANILTWASSSVCLHLVLDHDICDTAIVLPERGFDGSWHFRRVEIESEQNDIPLEMRELPDKEQIKSFIDSVAKAYPWQFCNDIWSDPEFLNPCRMKRFRNTADLITLFQSILNLHLGLDDILYLPVSELSESDSFLNFFISATSEAARFASTYNDGVNKYIVDNQGTIRHLVGHEQDGSIELPFWLISPDGERVSLNVVLDKSGTVTIANASLRLGVLDSVSRDGKKEQLRHILQRTGYKLRPKAVSLTLFVRLFLADWFVHGIGAGRYEPVTDYILNEYYGIKPPDYGTATCTMTLPISESETSVDSEISQLKSQLHKLKHNPEKYIDETTLQKEPVASLIKAKKQQIAIAGDESLSKDIRQSAWQSLLKTNQELFEYVMDIFVNLQKRITNIDKIKVSHEIINSREYFFGLFPKENLDRIVEAFTFSWCNRFSS